MNENVELKRLVVELQKQLEVECNVNLMKIDFVGEESTLKTTEPKLEVKSNAGIDDKAKDNQVVEHAVKAYMVHKAQSDLDKQN